MPTAARLHRPTLALLALSLLGGCGSLGAGTVSSDSFDYNQAISRSRDEQMLLNIVRLAYLEIPDFLAVSSVITSYTYGGALGVVGTRGFGRASDVVGGSAGVEYIERPTVTYAPLAGQDFSRRLMKPLPVDMMFALGHAGWPVDVLLTIALHRINDVDNMSFGAVPSPGAIDLDKQFADQARKLERFQRVLRLIGILASQRVLEVVRKSDDLTELPSLHLAHDPPEDMAPLVSELKTHLGLDSSRDEFSITDRATGRAPDEVLMQTRSLLAIMAALARGIDVPAEDKEKGVVITLAPEVEEAIKSRIPLRIRSSSSAPDDPYVAVRYRGHWFYVEHSDILSKRTFATILVLFQLLAPTGGSTAPLLSLPAG